MAKQELRFAVRTEDGRRSTIWKVWASKSDVYIQSRMMGSSSKVSLHESGECQYSMTSEWLHKNPDKAKKSSRHIVRRKIERPSTTKVLHIFQVTIPTTEIRHVNAKENLKKILWCNFKLPEGKVIFDFYLSLPLELEPDISSMVDRHRHLGSMHLADNRWLILFARSENITPEFRSSIEVVKEEICRESREMGISINPESRATAHYQNEFGLRGIYELCLV